MKTFFRSKLLLSKALISQNVKQDLNLRKVLSYLKNLFTNVMSRNTVTSFPPVFPKVINFPKLIDAESAKNRTKISPAILKIRYVGEKCIYYYFARGDVKQCMLMPPAFYIHRLIAKLCINFKYYSRGGSTTKKADGNEQEKKKATRKILSAFSFRPFSRFPFRSFLPVHFLLFPFLPLACVYAFFHPLATHERSL